VGEFANSRKRAAHPAARPTVQLPQNEWLTCPSADELHTICGKSDTTVPADASGDLKTAKFRHDSHYVSDDWIATYKPIRSHNEGIHGRLKSDAQRPPRSALPITPNRHRTTPETTKIPSDLAIGRDLVTTLELAQEQSCGGPVGI
jgi:hypothetical protein